MNRLSSLFARKKAGILNVYFTAGYPALNDTLPVITGLAAGGADLIEIGMPYSDPMADGPTIQNSGMQALANGMTLKLLFEQIREARRQTDVPLVLMGYYNQLLQYGPERFITDAAAAGVDGLILPDLPLREYERDYKESVEAAGLQFTFLITPHTTAERIRAIDGASEGFIYVVSSSAITGNSREISPQQIAYFERIAALNLASPRLIGFGISDRVSFETACRYAQGAIIGSAFIRSLNGVEDVAAASQRFVKTIKP